MSPRARKCQGCGASLPATPDGTKTLACAFCGTTHDLADDRGARTVVHIDRTKAATQVVPPVLTAVGEAVGRAVKFVFAFFVIGLLVVIMAVSLNWGQRAATPASSAATALRTSSALTPGDLPSISGGGWRQLQVAPPAAGWTGFDPVEHIDWALAIARAWNADARLTRIDAGRVSADGVADLTGAAVGYRFTSPARIAEWERLAAVDGKAEAAAELMMQVASGAVTVLVSPGRPSNTVVLPASAYGLTLRELLSRARRGKTFTEHPFYSGYLIHNAREGWVWYFQDLAQRESLPRVRARDGAVYPYRSRVVMRRS